jgi:hypothetical protein
MTGAKTSHIHTENFIGSLGSGGCGYIEVVVVGVVVVGVPVTVVVTVFVVVVPGAVTVVPGAVTVVTSFGTARYVAAPTITPVATTAIA